MKREEMSRYNGYRVVQDGRTVAAGVLICFHPITGEAVLRDASGNRWTARTENCEPLSGWRVEKEEHTHV